MIGRQIRTMAFTHLYERIGLHRNLAQQSARLGRRPLQRRRTRFGEREFYALADGVDAFGADVDGVAEVPGALGGGLAPRPLRSNDALRADLSRRLGRSA